MLRRIEAQLIESLKRIVSFCKILMSMYRKQMQMISQKENPIYRPENIYQVVKFQIKIII
jgi:hypothetical protein